MLRHPSPQGGGGGGTTSETVEQKSRGAPETDIAAGGGIRAEGGTAPLTEQSNLTQWPTPEDVAESAIAEARAETTRGGEDTGAGRDGREMGETGDDQRNKRGGSPLYRE